MASSGARSSWLTRPRSAASLNVGSNVLLLASGTPNSFDELIQWNVSAPGWTDGQQVSVSLTIPRAPDPDPEPQPKTAAPTVRITAGSTTIAPGGTVALTATATDSDGTIASYRWGARPVSRSYYDTTTEELSTTSGAETVWTAPERSDKYLRAGVGQRRGDCTCCRDDHGRRRGTGAGVAGGRTRVAGVRAGVGAGIATTGGSVWSGVTRSARTLPVSR